MSRRRDSPQYLAHTIYIECANGHRVGMVYLMRYGPRWVRDGNAFGIANPLRRIDGPQGETKVLAICETCRNDGGRAEPQIRWDRLQSQLEEMEQLGEPFRTITVA